MAGRSHKGQLPKKGHIIKNNPKVDGKVVREFDRLQKESGNAVSRTGANYRLDPPFSMRGFKSLSTGSKKSKEGNL